MPVETKEAKTLVEFTQIVETALTATRTLHAGDTNKPPKLANWYRGCGLETHKLTPGLYRHPAHKNVDELLKLERRMLEWFKRRSSVFPNAPISDDPEDWRSLFFMQHHHVPTRLLDWTDNPYIALYFALSSWEQENGKVKDKKDAAVWILDPIAWNKKALSDTSWGAHGPLTLRDSEIKGYAPKKSDEPDELRAMLDDAVAVYGIVNSARMVAQRGVFTVFGRSIEPMEKRFEDGFPKEALSKVVLPKATIPALLEALFSFGFTDSTAYPDLHGLALEIKRYFDFL